MERFSKILLRSLLIALIAASVVGVALANDDDLDTSWGSSGTFALDFGSDDQGVYDLVVLPNGKVVAVGVTDGDVVLIQLNEDGTPDSDFGSGEGYAVQDITSEGVFVYGVAIQSDGKIVVAGSEGDTQFFVARFNADGSLDTDFNNPDGYALLNFLSSQVATDVAIQSDGKIVLGGYSGTDFAIVRYNDDGTLDTAGFGGGNGYIVQDLGGSDRAWGMALQSDGKIVLGGYSDNDFAVARFETDGDLDTATFGGGAGFTTTDLGGIDRAYAVGLQSDEKIILAGEGNGDFAVARYTTAGALDTTFNSPTGYNLTDLGYSAEYHFGLAIDSSDRLIAAGLALDGTDASLSIFRYLKNGALDTDFSDDGWMVVNILNSAEFANAVALGSIIVGGTSTPDVDTGAFFIARFGVDDPTTTTTTTTTASTSTATLPETGFAPGIASDLGAQPPSAAYADYADLQLDIPSLGLELPIVGVPQSGASWDVSWLNGEAGYLAGTAFPTLPGNTALTGHLTDADGHPGPFANLDQLRYGDRIQIEAWGQTYTYEVRSNELVWANQRNVISHEDYDWVTLITCQGFDDRSGDYLFRRVVRAVLVSVE